MTMTLLPRRAGTIALLLAVGLTGGLSACSKERRLAREQRFAGQLYKAKASSRREDRRAFTIEVKPVSASLEGARQAGHYEAVKYCMRAFGSSDMEWQAAPDAAEETLSITEDTLMLEGRCAR